MFPIPGNRFSWLSERPSCHFKARQIIHARLVVVRDMPELLGFNVEIEATPPEPLGDKDKGISREEADKYAREVADGKHDFPPSDGVTVPLPAGATPFDIGVTVQSWVIVQLDPDVHNWQFDKGFRACTGKWWQRGKTFGVRNVYAAKDGGLIEPGNVSGDNCQVIYFGVAQRAYQGRERLNLHTAFRQHGGRMPVIFDPDVPNLGGGRIP